MKRFRRISNGEIVDIDAVCLGLEAGGCNKCPLNFDGVFCEDMLERNTKLARKIGFEPINVDGMEGRGG